MAGLAGSAQGAESLLDRRDITLLRGHIERVSRRREIVRGLLELGWLGPDIRLGAGLHAALGAAARGKLCWKLRRCGIDGGGVFLDVGHGGLRLAQLFLDRLGRAANAVEKVVTGLHHCGRIQRKGRPCGRDQDQRRARGCNETKSHGSRPRSK